MIVVLLRVDFSLLLVGAGSRVSVATLFVFELGLVLSVGNLLTELLGGLVEGGVFDSQVFFLDLAALLQLFDFVGFSLDQGCLSGLLLPELLSLVLEVDLLLLDALLGILGIADLLEVALDVSVALGDLLLAGEHLCHKLLVTVAKGFVLLHLLVALLIELALLLLERLQLLVLL